MVPGEEDTIREWKRPDRKGSDNSGIISSGMIALANNKDEPDRGRTQGKRRAQVTR
jgi:hypothetical protein